MTTVCPRNYILNSAHPTWEKAADKAEELQKKGLEALFKLLPSNGKHEYLVFQSSSKKKLKDIIYTMEPVRFRGQWEDHIRVGGKTLFAWDRKFSTTKSGAQNHLNRVLAKDPLGNLQKTWGFKIFRTNAGYGIFAEV